MEKQQIEAEVIQIIAEQLGQDPEQITLDCDLANDLSADSLDLAELMIAFEEKFELDIDDEALGKIETVGDVVEQIASQLKS